MDGWIYEQLTDRQTDRQTDRNVKSRRACPRLNFEKFHFKTVSYQNTLNPNFFTLHLHFLT